jgi:hypothetical protein
MIMPTMPEKMTETDEHLMGINFKPPTQLSTLCLILTLYLGSIAIAFL